jgi:Programmed cell death protein 2, C-terminal putative domain
LQRSTAMPGNANDSEIQALARRSVESCVVGYAADYGAKWHPGWRDTRLGGSVVLRPGAPKLEKPKCGVCERECVLVLQAFAPTYRHPDRILLVHGCNSMRCSEDDAAWIAQRLLYTPTSELPGECERLQQASAVPDSIPDDSGPSDGRSSDSDSGNDSGDEMEHMQDLLKLRQLQIDERLSARETGATSHTRTPSQNTARRKTRPQTRPSDAPSDAFESREHTALRPGLCLPLVPIEVDYDVKKESSVDEADANVQRLLRRYAQEESLEGESIVSTMRLDAEPDELGNPAEVARETFSACLARAPGHVVRYQRCGEPVWLTHPPPAAPPACVCGARRVFEMQLMPSCLHYLDVDKATPAEQTEAGMNWSTVAVYTCENDCEEAGAGALPGQNALAAVALERVKVQPDDF